MNLCLSICFSIYVCFSLGLSLCLSLYFYVSVSQFLSLSFLSFIYFCLQVSQLRHDLSMKDELLQFYTSAAEESEGESSTSTP